MTRPWPSHCDRCRADLRRTASTMSRFNEDVICVDCARAERGAPNYERARATEQAAVEGGRYDYTGIGLAPEDLAYLAASQRPTREETND